MSCYNYAENYRKGSACVKRHHEGRGVNPPLSFKTGVEQLVVNLHWSTANVNLIVDGGQNLSHPLIVPKMPKQGIFLLYNDLGTLGASE